MSRHSIIFLLLSWVVFPAPILAAGYELYITKIDHMSEDGFDEFSNPVLLESTQNDSPFPDLSPSTWSPVCIVPINEAGVAYTKHMFMQAPMHENFTEFYLRAKIKFNGDEIFTLNGQLEMRNKDGEIRMLSNIDFASLMGYFDAIYDMGDCVDSLIN